MGGYSISGTGGDKTQGSQGSFDFWIVKTDSSGTKQWDRRYGGTLSDELFSVRQTSDSGYLLGGWSSSGINGDKTQAGYGAYDFWLVKIDSSGNVLWDRDDGGTDHDQLFNMQLTPDHGSLSGGRTRSGVSGNKTSSISGLYDLWIVKNDSLGNKQWEQPVGGSSWDDEFGNISVTTSGYLIAGTSYSPQGGYKSENNLGVEQTWVINIDSSGNKIWDKTIFTTGHDENGFAVPLTGGCYLVANSTSADTGGYKSQMSRGSSDYWIVKFCDTTSASNLPYVGFFSSDTTFCEKQCIDFTDLSTNNPTSWQWNFPGGTPNSSTSQNPTGICYNGYGTFDVQLIACNSFGCDTLVIPGMITEYQAPAAPVITQTGDTLISSFGYSYAWYDTTNLTNILSTDSFYIAANPGVYFVVVSDSNGCSRASDPVTVLQVNETIFENGIIVAPNPTAGIFTISLRFTVYSLYLELSVYDVMGREVLKSEITNSKSKIDLGKKAEGIYLLRLTSGKIMFSKKIIVQR